MVFLFPLPDTRVRRHLPFFQRATPYKELLWVLTLRIVLAIIGDLRRRTFLLRIGFVLMDDRPVSFF